MRDKKIVNPTKKTIKWPECCEMAPNIRYRKGKYNNNGLKSRRTLQRDR